MIADGSVQMVATSPPYFGLRMYQGEQAVEWPAVTYRLNEWCEPVTVPPMTCGLGMESSPVAYIGHLILCLREWRRVLRDDGIVFCNLGDSYVGGKGASSQAWSGSHQDRKTLAKAHHHVSGKGETRPQDRRDGPIAPKNLLMIPAMFAIAARADGWYLRSDIVWAKPNPMPESVTDRPTKAHEYIFLLAKSARYFWDADAVREPYTESSIERKAYSFAGSVRSDWEGVVLGRDKNPHCGIADQQGKINPAGRNLRTVWNVSTSPFPGAHFACWPERLVEPMVKAGTSERGACPHCGKPWERVIESGHYEPEVVAEGVRFVDKSRGDKTRKLNGKSDEWKEYVAGRQTVGFRPACTCPPHEPVPCVVLDPFSGSGTTAKVAVRLGRRAIGVDISAEYLGDVTAQRFGEGVQMEMSL